MGLKLERGEGGGGGVYFVRPHSKEQPQHLGHGGGLRVAAAKMLTCLLPWRLYFRPVHAEPSGQLPALLFKVSKRKRRSFILYGVQAGRMSDG